MGEGKTDRKLSDNVANHEAADDIKWSNWDNESYIGGYGKKMNKLR